MNTDRDGGWTGKTLAGVLTLLLVHGIAVRVAPLLLDRGFIPVWLAFCGVAAGASALGWGLTSLLLLRFMPIGGAALPWMLAIALYPALAALFAMAHGTIADPDRA